MSGIYAVGMRTQVWSIVPKSSEVKQVMLRDMEFLKKTAHTGGAARGFYDGADGADFC